MGVKFRRSGLAALGAPLPGRPFTGHTPARKLLVTTRGYPRPMEMRLEETIRRVVAAELGVAPESLAPDVSLVDDLATDSLDLLELAMSLEEALGLTFSSDTIEQVRTYGELVSAVIGTARSRPLAAGTRLLQASVVTDTGCIVRMGSLTPYTLEEVEEDARRAGPGARLEIEL